MIINTGGRTDTVQYYSEWLLNRFKEGFVYVRNPLFEEKVSRYELDPKKVDCVVFCSKNYEPILDRLNEITGRFNTYFFYTITAYGKDIEPGVPGIDKSIDTLLKLEKLVGKEKIAWRYDPVLLTKKYTIQQHLITFAHMAARLCRHINRCIFSFVEYYRKVQFNMPELLMLSEEDMQELAKGFATIAQKYNFRLQTCATNQDFSSYGILGPGCIKLSTIAQANDADFKDLKHKGMRHGCTCMSSHDIGAYNSCPNGCKYCYANQSAEEAVKNYKSHEPSSPILLGSISEKDIVTQSHQVSFLKATERQLPLF